MSNVVRLRPALRSVIEIAREAFDAGDYRRALTQLDGLSDVGAVTLRMRMLRRYGAFAESAAAIADVDPGRLEHVAPELAAIYCALGGQALAIAGDGPQARAWATFARVYAAIAGDRATDAEVACILGETSAAYALGDPALAATAHETDAHRAHRAGRDAEALGHLHDALLRNDACDAPDRWLEADAIAAAAEWSAAVDVRESIAFFGDRFDRFRWFAELAERRARAAYHLGAAHAALNNVVAAYRYLRDADRRDAPVPVRVAALALRAEIAAELGERGAAAGSIANAAELALASGWNWAQSAPEARVAALQLAAALVHADPAMAEQLCMLAEDTGVRTLHERATSARDPALRATADLARGRVDAANGENARARKRVSEAFAAFTALEHHAAAGLCAIELRRLGIVTKDVMDALETIGARFAHSWIARRAARH